MPKLIPGIARTLSRTLARMLGYGLPVGLIMLLSLAIMHLQSRPELSLWHTVKLDSEFTAEQDINSFDEYLQTEQRVFEQLDQRVYQRIPKGQRQRINRYSNGSLSDPSVWPQNWNKSYTLSAPNAVGGVLLLHGMSDSPYSLRHIGQTLNDKGLSVIGLRYPGHGTAPSGMTTLRWEDMARAVELAMLQLKQQLGKRPVYIIGYSAGGALAVNYALQALQQPHLPAVKKLVLISPAIGVTSLASLAVWQSRLGQLLGLDKLEWTDIKPEYDPFKYNSFAVNAGDQVYRLTEEISGLLKQHLQQGDLDLLPPILAFQSSVDATVSTRALIDGLFSQLPDNGNQLVLFDINRKAEMEPLLSKDPKIEFAELLKQNTLPFKLSILSNLEHSPATVLLEKPAGSSETSRLDTGLSWPGNIYSLSHVALPFSRDDPLYGVNRTAKGQHIVLGEIASRGERGVLQVPAGDMLRLRSNPFYPVLEAKTLTFLGLN